MCAVLHFSPPNATTNTCLDRAKLDFDLFLTNSAEKLICKLQHHSYLRANKPDTPMSHTLRVIHQPKTSIRLKTSNNAYTSNPVKILLAFWSNLAKLLIYTGLTLPKPIPILTQEQLDILESPIMDLEVSAAIKAMKPNRHPGPDGFLAAYYRNFSPILTPCGLMPSTLLAGHSFRTETDLQFLCYPNLNQTSHGPTIGPSLNLDMKLLAKIIATPLNLVIGRLIQQDQTGLMPTCQAGNIRQAILLPCS